MGLIVPTNRHGSVDVIMPEPYMHTSQNGEIELTGLLDKKTLVSRLHGLCPRIGIFESVEEASSAGMQIHHSTPQVLRER